MAELDQGLNPQPAVVFEDHTDLEDDINVCEMDMGFLQKLEKTEIVPGVTKYTLKVPKERTLVEPDSHVHIYRQHRTQEGEALKPNNQNPHQGLAIKLGGAAHQELVRCIKTMCPEEISYFHVQRQILDKDKPQLDETLMTAEEKKREAGNMMMDGYHRVHLANEKKIKKNQAGVSETTEMRLAALEDCKKKGNQHFRDSEYLQAVKEYSRGLKLSINVPKKNSEQQPTLSPLFTRITLLRKQLINNGLKSAYKMKIYKDCSSFFDKEVVAEMKDDFDYINSITQIWADECKNPLTNFDVDNLIGLVEDFLRTREDLKDEETAVIRANLKVIKKYEREYNVLNKLKLYSAKAEEFERDSKIAEKIRQQLLEEDTENYEDLDVQIGVERAEDANNATDMSSLNGGQPQEILKPSESPST